MTYGYDAAGRVTSSTDDTGRVTTFTHDAANRLRTTTVGGATWTTTYDAAGRPTGYQQPSGKSSTFGTTGAGLDETLTLPGGNAYEVNRDAAGRLSASSLPSGAGTSLTYDAAGPRPVARVDPQRRRRGDGHHARLRRQHRTARERRLERRRGPAGARPHVRRRAAADGRGQRRHGRLHAGRVRSAPDGDADHRGRRRAGQLHARAQQRPAADAAWPVRHRPRRGHGARPYLHRRRHGRRAHRRRRVRPGRHPRAAQGRDEQVHDQPSLATPPAASRAGPRRSTAAPRSRAPTRTTRRAALTRVADGADAHVETYAYDAGRQPHVGERGETATYDTRGVADGPRRPHARVRRRRPADQPLRDRRRLRPDRRAACRRARSRTPTTACAA